MIQYHYVRTSNPIHHLSRKVEFEVKKLSQNGRTSIIISVAQGRTVEHVTCQLSVKPIVSNVFSCARFLVLRRVATVRVANDCRCEDRKQVVAGIDYRCEYGRSSVSVSCVTISNPNSLSSSETLNNRGI